MSDQSHQVQAYKLDISEQNSVYQEDDQQVKKMEQLILKSNKLGMEYLKLEKKNDSLELLKKCEKLLLSEYNKSQQNFTINKLLAITYNNLGCYYRKDEKPNVALNYLKKSLMIEVYSVHDSSTIASTHLNICAIFSRLNKHELAAEHAKIAIELLDLAKNSVVKKEEMQQLNQQLINEKDKEIKKKLKMKLKEYKNIMNVMIISYYNLAIEQEYLKQFDKSIQTYQAGYEIALQELGEGNKMTNTYIQNINRLQNAQQSKEKKEYAKLEKKQRIYEEGFHSYIKYHVKIDPNVTQNQANKFFLETYCQQKSPSSQLQQQQNSQLLPQYQQHQQDKQQQQLQPIKPLNLSKVRNTQSISPHSRLRSRMQEEEETFKTIENPTTNLQATNTTFLKRAQTVLRSRNDESFTPQRRRRIGEKFLELPNNNSNKNINNVGIYTITNTNSNTMNNQNSNNNHSFILNTNSQYHKSINDAFNSMMNKTTIKHSSKNTTHSKLPNNQTNPNHLLLLQPLKKTEKLPSIHQTYDPRQVQNQTGNQNNNLSQLLLAQNLLNGDNQTPSQQNNHIKQVQSNQITKDSKQTYRQKDKLMHQQSNTIDHEAYKYKVLNKQLDNTRFSQGVRAEQFQNEMERNRTYSTKNRQLVTHQNTYDFRTANTPQSGNSYALTGQTGNDWNPGSTYQQLNQNISNQQNEYKKKIGGTTIPTVQTQEKYNSLHTNNNPLITEKFNHMYTEKQITNTNVRGHTRQQDIDNLQGQVRKSLNFNENTFSQFEEKQQPDDQREQEYQECMDDLVDIYQNQNQSVISPDVSQDNIQSGLPPKSQNPTGAIKQIQPEQNGNKNKQQGEKELLEDQFKEYEQQQKNFKHANTVDVVIKNKTKNNQNEQSLFIIQKTIPLHQQSEQLAPYIALGTPGNGQHKSERPQLQKRQSFQGNQHSPKQKPLRVDPTLLQTNQQLNYSEDSEVVRIGNSERNSQNSQKDQRQLSQQVQQYYDMPPKQLQQQSNNVANSKQSMKRPDSHQENSIDLQKRRQMNQIRNIDENIRFYQNKQKSPLQSKENPVQLSKNQKNYFHRYASVNPATRNTRQNSSQQDSRPNQEEQNRKEIKSPRNLQAQLQQLQVQPKHLQQVNSTIIETNETYQNNLTQSMKDDSHSKQK